MECRMALSIVKWLHVLVVYVHVHVTSAQQITKVACLDGGTITLTCGESEVLRIGDVHVALIRQPSTDFCSNPFMDQNHCGNWAPTDIVSYFKECNTLSSCDRSMAGNMVGAALDHCTEFFTGDKYISVAYQCTPRIADFYDMSKSPAVDADSNTIYLLSPGYPKLTSSSGARCSLQYLPQAGSSTSGFSFNVEGVDGWSTVMGVNTTTPCAYVLLAGNFLGTGIQTSFNCIEQVGPYTMSEYQNPKERGSLFIDLLSQNPNAAGRLWLKIQAVKNGPSNTFTPAGGRIRISCSAVVATTTTTTTTTPLPTTNATTPTTPSTTTAATTTTPIVPTTTAPPPTTTATTAAALTIRATTSTPSPAERVTTAAESGNDGDEDSGDGVAKDTDAVGEAGDMAHMKYLYYGVGSGAACLVISVIIVAAVLVNSKKQIQDHERELMKDFDSVSTAGENGAQEPTGPQRQVQSDPQPIP